MQAEVIQFIGVDELNDEEKATCNDLANEYYDKIKEALKNVTSLVVHVKIYSGKGKENKHAKKYSICARAVAPTVIFDSTKAADWDLARTLHKAFKDLEHQIHHKFHDDVSCPDKPRRPQNKLSINKTSK